MHKVFTGVIPAALIPFTADGAIDETNYAKHLHHLAATPGVEAIVVNGHAGEVTSLSEQERVASLEIALQEIGPHVDVICGIAEGATREAVHAAKVSANLGADGLLLFPPPVFSFGHVGRPEIALQFYGQVLRSTDLPSILYIDPTSTKTTLPTKTIVKLFQDHQSLTGIKDFTNDILTYEDNFRALKELDRNVSVLSSFSRSLLASLSIGGDGILSGHGSIVADLHVELFEAVQRGHLCAARTVADRLYPLTKIFYADPFIDMHNRMKTALEILGRIDAAHVRAPQLTVTDEERYRISEAVQHASLPHGVVAMDRE